jgi:hypothetical protein
MFIVIMGSVLADHNWYEQADFCVPRFWVLLNGYREEGEGLNLPTYALTSKTQNR